MRRRPGKLRLSLIVLAIVGAQALLTLHWYEHPVLSTHTCRICHFCSGAAHAVTASPIPMLPAAAVVFLCVLIAVFLPIVAPPDSSIRAPPLKA